MTTATGWQDEAVPEPPPNDRTGHAGARRIQASQGALVGAALVIALGGMPSTATALSSDDLEKLAASRVAIEKERDCDRAIALLDSVSAPAKDSNRWLGLAARANECSGALATAVEYFRALDARLPPSAQRSRMIATLEARRGAAFPNRQARPIARGTLEPSVGDEEMDRDAPAAPGPPEPTWTHRREELEGRWTPTSSSPTRGALGETYHPRFLLEVRDREAIELRGQVFVEPEFVEEKQFDGSVQWYELEAHGKLSDEGITINGICTAKVWDFESAGVVSADARKIAGSFVPRGRKGTMSFEASPLSEAGCGGNLGMIERIPLGPVR